MRPASWFLAAALSGLLAVPAASSPRQMSSLPLPEPGFGIAVDGNRAGVTVESGLWLVDVTNPFDPLLRGHLWLGARCFGVVIGNDLAYIAAGTLGLVIADISDPGSPRLVGWRHLPDFARAVALRDNLAFVSQDVSGIAIVDVSQPATPRLLSTLGLPGQAYDLAVAGDDLFVSSGRNGLLVVDVGDPASPELVATFPVDTEAGSISLAGRYAYLCETFRVDVLDLENPRVPRLVGNWPQSHRYDVSGTGRFMCIAAGEVGLELVDVLDPSSPRLTARLPLNGSCGAIAVQERRAYLVDDRETLHLVDLSLAAMRPGVTPGARSTDSPPGSLVALPSPFHETVVIRLEGSAAGNGRASIFDLAGRRVRRLAGPGSADGAPAWRWDARDDAGRLVRAGIYWARIDTPAGALVTRLVLTR